jgi:hypothetical protein
MFLPHLCVSSDLLSITAYSEFFLLSKSPAVFDLPNLQPLS